MSRQLFGTDGIRGTAGKYPLNSAGCIQIGMAIGEYFASPGDTIVVGFDPRESSPQIANDVTLGLNSVGVDVTLVGVIPTPGLAYVTKNGEFVAGVMITASHNPYTDNGIKVFSHDGTKLPDNTEEKLNDLIESSISAKNQGVTKSGVELIKTYEDFLVNSANGYTLNGLNIAIDCANGATSNIASNVFSKLGANVSSICDSPNGTNINVACGATDTNKLQSAVTNNKLDGGLAFDGDGDRLMMVDALGRQLDGDNIMYILAVTSSCTGVVSTVMSNLGFENALKSLNIDLRKTAVGDRYVLEELESTGYKLGGEQSGHLILKDFAGTGDGMLAGIQTLIAILKSKRNLSRWYEELKKFPQALINIPLADKTLLDLPEIKNYINAQTKELGAEGRILIRPSGTEPKARVMVESKDADTRARIIADRLREILKEASFK